MGPGGLPSTQIILGFNLKTSIYKKQEVVKCPTILTIDNYNKVNLQENWEVYLSMPLEIKYTQQNI